MLRILSKSIMLGLKKIFDKKKCVSLLLTTIMIVDAFKLGTLKCMLINRTPL